MRYFHWTPIRLSCDVTCNSCDSKVLNKTFASVSCQMKLRTKLPTKLFSRTFFNWGIQSSKKHIKGLLVSTQNLTIVFVLLRFKSCRRLIGYEIQIQIGSYRKRIGHLCKCSISGFFRNMSETVHQYDFIVDINELTLDFAGENLISKVRKNYFYDRC